MAKRGFLEQLIKAFVGGLQGAETAKRPIARRNDQEPTGFPVGIVGESNYQKAIRQCHAGEVVSLFREPANLHDPNAIAVVCARGNTIGYIGRDSFVHRAVHKEGRGIEARILSLKGGKNGIGVVLDVEILARGDRPVGERSYEP